MDLETAPFAMAPEWLKAVINVKGSDMCQCSFPHACCTTVQLL